ncbi:carboxypeptidase B-like [Cloeon dipterum]|uniref:carboxypeptidase B-like n=1 Tax=Cloeon dipterum TaxID=197152 RepID=UPI00321F9408
MRFEPSACALLLLLTIVNAVRNEDFRTDEPANTTPVTEDNESFTENFPTDGENKNVEEQYADYTGAQVFSVKLRSSEHKRMFQQLEDRELIDVWLHKRSKKRSRAEFMVLRENMQEVLSLFYEADIQPKIVIPNMQRLIEKEKKAETLTNSTLRSGHGMNWNEYHRYSTIHSFLLHYANAYPDICTLKTIGKTVENRDIQMLKISSGGNENKTAIFIDGGMHAREWITPAAVTYIIKELVDNRAKYRSFVDDVDFHIVPLVNVDGYEYSHTRDRLWRKNRADLWGPCNGVDLNRNFGYKWGTSGSSFIGCSQIYRGSAGFSEPESKAIRDYIMESAANFQAYLSFHSYGQLILYPYGYANNELPSDANDLKRLGNAAASAVRKLSKTRYTVGNSAEVLYRSSGASDDWAKGEAGIKYSYVVELSDTGKYGFMLPERLIKPTAADALEIVKVVADEVMGL